MEFFDKKEDVLDVQLTEYGKNLLANGNLNPVYYAFFDDDIMYDVSGSGYSEIQNQVEPRIQDDTPKLKIIRTRTSAETRVNEFLNNLETAIGSTNSDPANNVAAFKQQQPFAAKGKVDAYPLGRSSLNSQYNPAWQIEVLSKPVIQSAQRYLAEDDYIDNTPQINIDIDYQILFEQGEITFEAISGYLGDTNVYLTMRENYLMMEILEDNTDFEKENFDVEVYLSQSVQGYVQKSYMIDDPTQFIEPTMNNVEYYMNLLVDNEIPSEIISELNISDKAVSTSASRLKLNRDLYTTENEEPCD
ncbi:MAG TPA: hypothetical protein EYN67_10985 [Flavobacteriales bacterium]|nr:hypothetical protein [Flavobacteriales bacterium]HIO49632.1 hypothetical protein [Candidatus Poribacteria bacterium]